MNAYDRARIKNAIRDQEGFRAEAYLDTLSVPTIGWGTTFYRTGPNKGRKVQMGDTITRGGAEEELNVALADCEKELAAHPATREILATAPHPVFDVLVEFTYNVGINRLAKFKKALLALQRGHYTRAACEFVDSRWATQVGSRRVVHILSLLADAADQ